MYFSESAGRQKGATRVSKPFMKNPILLLLGACAATAAFAQSNDSKAATTFYVQPSFVIAMPGDDFDTAPGLAIAAGATFGRRHSVEAELIHFETEPKRNYFGYDLFFTYALATYKYTFPITEKFSAFAGGSIGLVAQKGEVDSGYYSIGDATSEAVAVGATGGVRYQLNERIAFAGGVKVIGQDDTRFTTSGSVLLVQGSVSFQF
jgi:Outer membrane protein beta-barrel domain